MRFKLDENFDARLASLLAERGQDADSVTAEGLGGAFDERSFAECVRSEVNESAGPGT